MTALAVAPDAINTYWATVAQRVQPDHFSPHLPVVDWTDGGPHRRDMVSRFSWTITDPATVAFVTEHSGGRLVDPMAGSGWWARLLYAAGVDVHAVDLLPAHWGDNPYHKAGISHMHVRQGDAVETASRFGWDRTLLLSWPPYDEPIGAETLAAYTGQRVIYIGEGWGGCCGSDRMFELLEVGWNEVAQHRPVQWWGMHDYVTVYERRRAVAR